MRIGMLDALCAHNLAITTVDLEPVERAIRPPRREKGFAFAKLEVMQIGPAVLDQRAPDLVSRQAGRGQVGLPWAVLIEFRRRR